MSESDSAFENRVSSIFLRAVELVDPEHRSAYLDSACANDAKLRLAVDGLLAAHEELGAEFLEQPVPHVEPTVDLAPSAMDAGRATGFNSESAVVVRSVNHSVLRSLSKTIPSVPNVTLPSEEDDIDPVVQPRSQEIPLSKAVSRYQLLGEIARGGMGAIIKGRDTDLGRDLALKVLLESHSNKPELISRFVEEAQIGGQLQHPSIVPVYELGQFEDQRPFFTMKLVKGQTLAAILASRKSPQDDLQKIMGVFEQVCQAMGYAHNKNVIQQRV